MQGFPEEVIKTICDSWRSGTEKQYSLAWKKWCIWCVFRKRNPVCTSEVTVLSYFHFLLKQGKSYSVLNTHKSMLLQTLKLLGNFWCNNPQYVSRFMKGVFNKLPPVPRYTFTWDVSSVLQFLRTLFPLGDLSLKMLTLKTVALVSLAIAPRAQTLVAMNLDCMKVFDNKLTFVVTDLLKTSKPGKSCQLDLYHFHEEPLCVMHTLLYYIERIADLRKSRQLFVSFCSFRAVTSSTIARWLKNVLQMSGIDVSVFKAHSFRGAAASAAFRQGCSIREILKTGDWSSVKNFKKFYLRDVQSDTDPSFAEAVFS